jgi:putative salt-induced outer membrane protein YdiY
MRRAAVLVICLCVCAQPLAAKRKDDVVVMKNGDRFTGEIKQLAGGELQFKATYMSASVDLNWQDVDRIESKDAFIVGLVDGSRIYGLLEMPSQREKEEGVVRIKDGGSVSTISHSEVVEIEQTEKSFLRQLRGSVDLGLSYASGNQSADYYTAVAIAYRTRKDEYSVNATSDFSRNNAESTARHTLTLEQQHMLAEKWFTIGIADFLNSRQQELSLRSTFGGGLGRRLFQSEHTRLAIIGGAAYTHETYSPHAVGPKERSNAEAFAGLRFYTFRFRTLTMGASTSIYPSMNDPGRVRFVTNGDLKIELVRNLYWKFHAYENFDNRPPVNAPRNDFGTSSSLGWSF